MKRENMRNFPFAFVEMIALWGDDEPENTIVSVTLL